MPAQTLTKHDLSRLEVELERCADSWGKRLEEQVQKETGKEWTQEQILKRYERLKAAGVNVVKP